MRLALVVAATLLLPGAGTAEETPKPGALPCEAFGPRTLAVVRVRLSGLTSARAEQAVRAVMPAKWPADSTAETIAGARAALDPLQAKIGKPLRDAGLEHFYVLFDGADFDDFEPRVALPVRGPRARDQIEAVRAVAAGAGLSVKLVPGCVVLFKGAPPTSDAVTIDEAAFREALAAAPDDDVVVVVVPPEAMRKAMRAEHARMLEKRTGRDEMQGFVRGARDVVDADWFCVSALLGPEPVVRLRARLTNEEAARRLRASVDAFCDYLKNDWTRTSVSEDGTRIYDPALGHKMIDAVRLETDGPHAVLNLTAARMRTFLDGFLAAAEWIGEAIADLVKDEDDERKE